MYLHKLLSGAGTPALLLALLGLGACTGPGNGNGDNPNCDTGDTCNNGACPNADANGDGILTLGAVDCADGSEFGHTTPLTNALFNGAVVEVLTGYAPESREDSTWDTINGWGISDVEIYGETQQVYVEQVNLGPNSFVHDITVKAIEISGDGGKAERTLGAGIHIESSDVLVCNNIARFIHVSDRNGFTRTESITTNVSITHNTVVSATVPPFEIEDAAVAVDGLFVGNNIFRYGLQVEGPLQSDVPAVFTGTYVTNMYFDVDPDITWPNPWDTSDAWVVTDPGFVEPIPDDWDDFTTWDFHLASSSVGIDAGADLTQHAPSDDFDGDTRSAGAGPDVGADEAM